MKNTFIKFLFLLVIGAGINFTANAQTVQNFSTIKIDELPDTKIRELMARAESMGLSDAQLEQTAFQQGMKQEEIVKLRKRVADIRKKDGSKNKVENNAAVSSNGERKYTDGQTDSTSKENQPTRQQLLDKAFDDLKPKIFGSEFFKNSEMTFEPNLRIATPKGYIIGPDDQLLIDISGDSDREYDLKVSPGGTIRMEFVGPIAVGGLTVDQAESKIRNLMAPYYPAIRSGKTQIAVTIGNIRSIKVTVSGNVRKPGSFTISSLSTVFNAIYFSGGPSDNGSYRKVQVIRNNKPIATLDLYDVIINGVQKNNIRLQDQDVINVP
ncbi:MAG: polysaccharide export protein, partial [Flavobacterium sp.]